MNENLSNEEPDRQAQRAGFLIAGFFRRALTRKEHDELDAWLIESEVRIELFEDICNEEFQRVLKENAGHAEVIKAFVNRFYEFDDFSA